MQLCTNEALFTRGARREEVAAASDVACEWGQAPPKKRLPFFRSAWALMTRRVLLIEEYQARPLS